MGPRKGDNYMKDLMHWAEMNDASLSPEAANLMKTDARPPLRAAMVAAEMGRFREFHYPAYRARWCDGRDMSKPEVLAELFEQAGLDVAAAMTRAESDEIDDRLEKNTQEAIERGVFGVPTMFVGDEMFWGNDRFELVRFYIERAKREQPAR
jgi:2-hydroxychromene-2-carboxylate isomerase